jgi:hypothetical protein
MFVVMKSEVMSPKKIKRDALVIRTVLHTDTKSTERNQRKSA